ncbi:MAG: LysE/ArgO family amino acid transporter [Rickettsiales bacterium]
MNFYPIIFIKGMSIAFSLIIAIGMQNAFVLKQGILRKNSFLIASLCSIIDVILIIFGVYGLGQFLSEHKILLTAFSWGGVLFLFGYSIMSFYSSFKKHSLNINSSQSVSSIKKTIIQVIVISFINPSAFLETCVLIGSVSTQFEKDQLPSFTLGASASSFIWFFALSYGARFLKPIFEKPIAWKILDFIIGCIMLAIAISFARTLEINF